jgi:hypothetical protein
MADEEFEKFKRFAQSIQVTRTQKKKSKVPKPTVMISHRCKFYHEWKCKETIEVFMMAFGIKLLYGCKLHYCTGDLE